MTDDLTKWYSTPQAAKLANVSRQMLNRLVRSGAVESKWTPLGRLVSPASLQKYIDVREQRQTRLAARRSERTERTEAPVIA